MKRHPAYFTYDSEAGAYYFAPENRSKPLDGNKTRKATVLLDIAADGTLAGIELLVNGSHFFSDFSDDHTGILPPKTIKLGRVNKNMSRAQQLRREREKRERERRKRAGK